MVEPELTFFQVQFKSLFGNTVELHQPTFGNTPEGLNTVHMVFSSDELIAPWLTLKCLSKPISTSLKMMVLLNALRPRLPRIHRAPKYDSSASSMPVNGEHSIAVKFSAK